MPARERHDRPVGGDEFGVLLPGGAGGIVDAAALAQLAAGRILEPVWFADALLTPEVSIGIAVSPAMASRDLLRCVDTAMHVAKSRTGSVAVYEPGMDSGPCAAACPGCRSPGGSGPCSPTVRAAVTALGCQVGQGYLISRPLAAPVIHAWLDDYQRAGGSALRLVPDSA